MLLCAKAQGYGMEVGQANAKYWQVDTEVTHEYWGGTNIIAVKQKYRTSHRKREPIYNKQK